MTMEREREHWPKWTNHDHPIVPRHFAAVARPTRFRYSDQHLTWIERGGMTRLSRRSDRAYARPASQPVEGGAFSRPQHLHFLDNQRSVK